MPTPLGHALGGFIAGWLVAGGRLQASPKAWAGRASVAEKAAGGRGQEASQERVGRPSTDSEQAGPGQVWRPSSSLADKRSSRSARWLAVLGFALVGMAPDLDLLVGRHSQFTHSIGAAAAVFALALLLLRRQRHALLLALAVAAAYASHPLLDWLGEDATPPYGITALWPFNGAYHSSHLDLFRGIARYYWRPGALQQNVLAVGREILILAPLALGAWWLRRPAGPSRFLHRDAGGRRQGLQSSRAGDR